MKNIINYFLKKPRTLFLLDGFGAALTTFSLYFVLRHYHDYIRMPITTLTYLSGIGLCFCVYSMLCYFLINKNWTPYLRVIGIGNFLYCVLTMALLYINYNNITKIGLTYFLNEILIIVLLVYIELSVSNILKIKQES